MRPGRGRDEEGPLAGYATSTAWVQRGERWLAEQLARTGQLSCVVCWHPVSPDGAELHHLSRSGVTHAHGRWIAKEEHDDLCAMDPGCHRRVHQALDGHPLLTVTGVRPVSSVQATRIARDGLTPGGAG